MWYSISNSLQLDTTMKLKSNSILPGWASDSLRLCARGHKAYWDYWGTYDFHRVTTSIPKHVFASQFCSSPFPLLFPLTLVPCASAYAPEWICCSNLGCLKLLPASEASSLAHQACCCMLAQRGCEGSVRHSASTMSVWSWRSLNVAYL